MGSCSVFFIFPERKLLRLDEVPARAYALWTLILTRHATVCLKRTYASAVRVLIKPAVGFQPHHQRGHSLPSPEEVKPQVREHRGGPVGTSEPGARSPRA